MSARNSLPNTSWPTWGNDPGGTRFAPLRDITPANVGRLVPAWRLRTGDLGEGFASGKRMAFEATPILVDSRLFLSTPYGHVLAVHPATGAVLWRFDSRTPKNRNYSENTSRGVSYWRDTSKGIDAACAGRILFGTLDARLLALDARTGRPCSDFGAAGTVNLNTGSRPRDPGGYLVSSPPVLWNGLVITGSAIGDNRAVDVELGIVRAFDARTGALVWQWDPIPRSPANPLYREWPAAGARATGAANAWTVLSVDHNSGLVFVPTGSASPDFYGGERQGDNRHANSLVALDARTGSVRWAQQLVHHDIWDYDLPAQPVLFDLQRGGAAIPAVLQATKMGMLFVFHRDTGEPLFPIEERPVPRSDVPGEVAARTQPFSSLPPLVSHRAITPDDAWGLTPLDRYACKRRIAALRSEGIYTPPSLRGTLLWPGYTGGSNWGGVAIDPAQQIVIANVNRLPFEVRLIPRAEADAAARDRGDADLARQAGTPYLMRRELLDSPLGIPCTSPPWGTLAAFDLRSQRVLWEVPLGTSEDFAPWPFDDIAGVPNLGGAIVTASGLVFIAAAGDDYLRAFDLRNGRVLWQHRLPAGGQAVPMTYRYGGRQFVVIAAGGHGNMTTTRGDHVIAFALPAPSATATR